MKHNMFFKHLVIMTLATLPILMFSCKDINEPIDKVEEYSLSNPQATSTKTSVIITWEAKGNFDNFTINRNGKLIAEKINTQKYTDKSPIEGVNQYEIIGIVNGEQKASVRVEATFESNDEPEPTNYTRTGLYLGITSFNDHIAHANMLDIANRYTILNQNSKSGYLNFINNMSTAKGTALYYAVDENLQYLSNCTFPSDLVNVSIITFTDGLDQGSRAFDDQYSSEQAYTDAIQQKIKTIKFGNIPITAYSIGVKGNDVQDNNMFTQNLKQLSSDPVNAFEVSNMDEVNKRFEEIAESLYKENVTISLTLSIPAPYDNTRERFTFDVINSAEESQCYIEGIYVGGKLTEITYQGITSTSGTNIIGVKSGINYQFTFENIELTATTLNKNNIKQWSMSSGSTVWQINSEFDPLQGTHTQEERSSAVVMLILDCSSSLGSDFAKVKTAATNFVKILAGDNSSTEPEPDPEPVDFTQVRFQKTKDYETLYRMCIGEIVDETTGEFIKLAEYEFGTSAGISNYFLFEAGIYTPLVYAPDNEGNFSYYLLDEPFTYNFKADYKYTFQCTDDGEYLVFQIIQDGKFNAPQQVVAQKRIAKRDIPKMRKINVKR